MYLVICWFLSRDSTKLFLIMVVKFALALIFIAAIGSRSFTYVTWLDKGCTKSEFLTFNSSSTPCSWWGSEMVPVLNKAFKRVPPKSNRLRSRSNEAKMIKSWSLDSKTCRSFLICFIPEVEVNSWYSCPTVNVCFDNSNYFVRSTYIVAYCDASCIARQNNVGLFQKKALWFSGWKNSSATTIYNIHPVTHRILHYIMKSIWRKQAYNLSLNSRYKFTDLET
jgi:hypothetical protein